MRDPWGICVWKGKWKKKDKLWKKISDPRFNKDRIKHGSFFINFADFQKCFNSVKICYYYDNFKYSAQTIENVTKDEYVTVDLNIPCKGEYFFSISQINSRFYKGLGDYKYSIIWMALLKKHVSGRVEYVKGAIKDFKEFWIKQVCGKGNYCLVLKANWKSFINQFTVSAYGKGIVEIKQVLFISQLLY